jgi:hypothetical protein
VGFCEHRGFTARQRNTVHRNGEWLANTTVEKKLTNDPLTNDPEVAP